MKNRVMILALDDGPHLRNDLLNYRPSGDSREFRKTPLIAVACKGLQLVHVDHTYIDVDGFDATEKILDLYHRNPFKPEIRLIMVDSPTVGGFNVLNPMRIHAETGIPLLLVPDSEPKSPMVDVYSHVFPDRKEQIDMLRLLPPIESHTVSIKSDPKTSGQIFFHTVGISKSEVNGLLNYLAEYSFIPEPLRLAHTIAADFVTKDLKK